MITSKFEFDPNGGNIYFFGDSFNDPGQFRLVKEGLSLDNLNVALQSSDGARSETIHIRGQNGCASNGKIQADFVAKRLNMVALSGFAVRELPERSGIVVNFALSGAAHTNNSSIYFSEDKSEPSFDVAYQIEKARELRSSLSKKDICIIQVTFNDIFLIYQVTKGQQGNWPIPQTPEDLEQKYVSAAVKNIQTLYSMGCRRLLLPVFTNLEALKTPNWKKITLVDPGAVAAMDARLARMQKSLRMAIAEKIQKAWADMSVELVDATPWWEQTQAKMNVTSTLTDEGWTAASGQKNERKYFFFDDTHPTQEAHKKLAKFLSAHLQNRPSSPTACRVEEIPYNKDVLKAVGSPITLLFKVSETLSYKVTCPKECLLTASDYFKTMFQDGQQKWEEGGKSLFEIDLCALECNMTKKHFELISEYITIGDGSQDLYNVKWNLEDSKAFYTLTNFLQMTEFTKAVEKDIIGHVSENWRECLTFGIWNGSSAIVKEGLECLMDDFRRSIQRYNPVPTKQYLMNELLLMEKSVTLLSANDAKTVKKEIKAARASFNAFVAK